MNIDEAVAQIPETLAEKGEYKAVLKYSVQGSKPVRYPGVIRLSVNGGVEHTLDVPEDFGDFEKAIDLDGEWKPGKLNHVKLQLNVYDFVLGGQTILTTAQVSIHQYRAFIFSQRYDAAGCVWRKVNEEFRT